MKIKWLLLIFGAVAGVLVVAAGKPEFWKRAGSAMCETVCDLAKCRRFSCCK